MCIRDRYNRKRFLEKAQMKKNIAMHNESVHKKRVEVRKFIVVFLFCFSLLC